MKPSCLVSVVLLVLCSVVVNGDQDDRDCRKPLGMVDKGIRDNQIKAASIYGNNSKYAPYWARLHHQGGYRADPRSQQAWILVWFDKATIITGIATQGYGAPPIQEWLVNYILGYTYQSKMAFFVDRKGSQKTKRFIGNTDSNSVVLNYVPVPVTVDSLTIIPLKWHGGFAIRFELYGCLADGYECISTPCQNNGTCVDQVAGYHCNCTTGFNGINCQYNIDDCVGVVCQHGGNCTDLVNDYSCDCPAGFSGRHCEIDINECASYPCLHGGTCRDTVNGYECSCSPGFGGTNCQEEAGFYLVVWLQIKSKVFTTKFLDKTSTEYTTTALQVIDEITRILHQEHGFLSAQIRKFSPGESVMVEVEIECLISSTSTLMNTTRHDVIKGLAMFKDNYVKFENTANPSCTPPKVTLTLSKTMTSPTDVSRYLNITITMQALLTCRVFYLYQATIYSIDNSTGIFKQVFATHGNLATNTTWMIPAKALHYGIHYVKVTSSVAGRLGTNSIVWGLLRVGETRLVSRITSANNITYQGNKEFFYLNGSQSYDPDLGPGDYKGIEFIWLCRRDNETFTGDPTTFPFVRPGILPLDRGGCYGNGVGRLQPTEGSPYVVGLDVDKMKGNIRYVIALVVKKEQRTAWSELSLSVKEEISIALKCVQNCRANVILTERLVLEQRCKGLLCDKINSYEWTLQIFDPINREWSKVPDLSNYILTYMNSPNLVTRENTLKGDSPYMVTLTAKAPGNIIDSTRYRFSTNAPPSGGRCTVDTNQGKAWLTYFGFSCFGWKDQDLPLLYKFRYNTSDGIDMVFFSGKSNFVRARLPVGDRQDEFRLKIEIHVADSLGSEALAWLYVKVYEPDIPSVGLEEAVGAQSDMSKYLQDNNIEMAAQHATSVLSVVNNASPKDLVLARKIKIKDSIVKSWSSITVKNVEEMGQVCAVVSAASEKKTEVSMESQESIVNLLQNMAAVLEDEAANNKENEIKIQNVGSGMLQGIANVMEVAAWNASTKNIFNRPIRVTRDTENVYMNRKSISLVTKTSKLVDKVADSLVKTKKLYEKPTVFKTKSMSLVLDRQKPGLIGGKAIQDGDTRIVLPPAESLLNNHQESQESFLSSQLVSMATNPFTWDASADNIRSSVLDFKLKTPRGSNLQVHELDKDFSLFIPMLKRHKPVKQQSYFVKPSQNGSMQYHVINIPGSEYAVSVQLWPLSKVNMTIYVRYGARPTSNEYNYTAMVPNYDTCNLSSPEGTRLNCSADPYTVTLSSALTGHVGIHYLGIKYRTMVPRNATDPLLTRTKRDCFSESGRQKRALCVQVKDPPPTKFTRNYDEPKYDPEKDVNYTLSVTMATCLYWDVATQKWTSRGCKVGPFSKVGLLHCMCNHLTSFGGNFFVAPNPIDFDKVLQRFTDFEVKNFVVFIVVFGIFGLYLVALVMARRADRKDEVKAVETLRLLSSADYHYEISIYTGMWRNNGTTANVAIKIYGQQGESDALYLSDRYSKRKLFARASINNFMVSLPDSLGAILGVKLWHGNEGDNPSWFVTQVVIHDLQKNTPSYIICNRWLAVDKENGEVQANFAVATKEELSSFKYQFSTRVSKSLCDSHLWLSVATRPPHSPFTRVQRVSCCLSVLYCAMLASAMFYQFGKKTTEDTYKFGALRFSVRQLVIGLQSALVIVPLNILIVTIFRNTRPPQKTLPGKYSLKNEKRAKPPGCLPYFFVYLGWFLCVASVAAAGSFTILYSLSWGGDVANEWLTSVLIAFVQDIGVIQPIKVVGLAIVLALILKKPMEEKTAHSMEKANLEVNERATIEPPQGEKLQEARSYSNNVSETMRAVGEIFLYLLFVCCLMIFVYQNRGYDRYRLTRSVKEIFSSSFKEISTTKEFWEWSKDTLVPGLYHTNWYTTKGPKIPEGYISTKEAFLVGMPRFRQIRLKQVSPCEATQAFPWSGLYFSHCIPPYEPKYEERTRYNLPRWIPVKNTSIYGTIVNLQRLCPKPWRYQSSGELNTFSLEGVQTSYDGGGYVADLGYNSLTALNVIGNLQSNHWIDRQTVLVVVEFTVFEPSSLLFSHTKFLVEMAPSTGQPVLSFKLDTLSLYESQEASFRPFFLAVQILLLLFIFCYLISETVKIMRLRCRYFTSFWNWMNLIQILAAIAATVLFFFKATFVSRFIKHVQANPYETTSMDMVLLWCNLELHVISIIIFVVTIKFLRLLRFNRHICQMNASMKHSFGRITTYTFVFLVDMISFAFLGVLVFGSTIHEYSNIVESLRSLFQTFLGGELLFEEIVRANRIIGPLFVFTYMVSMTFILVNMFVAILNDSYDSVRSISGGRFPDSDLGLFMRNYYKRQYHLVHDTLKLKLGKIGFRTKSYKPNKEKAKDLNCRENGSGLVSYSSLSSNDFPLEFMNHGFTSESLYPQQTTTNEHLPHQLEANDPDTQSLDSDDVAMETATTDSMATTSSAELLDMISDLPESLVDDEDTVDAVREKLSNVGAILRISKRSYRRFSTSGDKFVVQRNLMVGQPVELKFTPKMTKKLQINFD